MFSWQSELCSYKCIYIQNVKDFLSSTVSSQSYYDHHMKSAAAVSPTLKNANVTCNPAVIKVERMLAIISLPLISVLTTGFPREKIFGLQGTFHERMHE